MMICENVFLRLLGIKDLWKFISEVGKNKLKWVRKTKKKQKRAKMNALK